MQLLFNFQGPIQLVAIVFYLRSDERAFGTLEHDLRLLIPAENENEQHSPEMEMTSTNSRRA